MKQLQNTVIKRRFDFKNINLEPVKYFYNYVFHKLFRKNKQQAGSKNPLIRSKFMHKKKLLLIILIPIFIIGLFIFFPKRENLSIRVGDSIGNIVVENIDGKHKKIESCMPEKYVIAYISSGCHPCIDELPSIELLCKVSQNTKQPFVIVWRSSIPNNICNNEIYNYTLKNSEFGSFTPCFYLVEKNNIIFETQNLDKIIKKMVSSANSDELQKSFINYYVKKNNIEKDNVYFIFTSHDVEEQIVDIPDDAEVITISDEKAIDTIYDPCLALSYMFGITKYPSLVKCDTKTFEYEVLD